MAPETVSLALNQGRAPSGAGALQRLADGSEDLLRIVTIHDLSRDHITLRPVRNVLHGGRALGRHRHCPAVVFAQKYHGQLAHRAEVHAFVEGAAIGGAVAEEAQDCLVTTFHFDRETGPASDGKASTKGAAFA